MSRTAESILRWIDAQETAMVEQLLAWGNVNSGSYNLAGLGEMLSKLQHAFEPLPAVQEILDLPPAVQIDDHGESSRIELGRALRIRKHTGARHQVFLGGHMDTVFSPDSTFQSCRYLDRNTINGPGVADLKGGLLVMLYALLAFERSEYHDRLDWEILINPDEEIGSHGSAALLAEAAARNHFGLVFEPALADGTLAGQRKGSGNFSLVVKGRAAHAGREHHLGRNALVMAASLIGELARLTDYPQGITVNPAKMVAGSALNVVPDLAVCHFNIRMKRMEQQQAITRQLQSLCDDANREKGYEVSLHGDFSRPPKVLNQANEMLFAHVKDCGRELDLDIRWVDTGGCCDGNNLLAAGLPNVDTLGVRGGRIHSDQEFMLVESLCERAKLAALLLTKIAGGELTNPAFKA